MKKFKTGKNYISNYIKLVVYKSTNDYFPNSVISEKFSKTPCSKFAVWLYLGIQYTKLNTCDKMSYVGL